MTNTLQRHNWPNKWLGEQKTKKKNKKTKRTMNDVKVLVVVVFFFISSVCSSSYTVCLSYYDISLSYSTPNSFVFGPSDAQVCYKL